MLSGLLFSKQQMFKFLVYTLKNLVPFSSSKTIPNGPFAGHVVKEVILNSYDIHKALANHDPPLC